LDRLKNSANKLNIGFKLTYDPKTGKNNLDSVLKGFSQLVGPFAGTEYEDVIMNGRDKTFVTNRSTKTKSGTKNSKNSLANSQKGLETLPRNI